MARPNGGYLTEDDGEEDILEDCEAHHHPMNTGEYLACITLADGTTSMRLDRLHGAPVHQSGLVICRPPPNAWGY